MIHSLARWSAKPSDPPEPKLVGARFIVPSPRRLRPNVRASSLGSSRAGACPLRGLLSAVSYKLSALFSDTRLRASLRLLCVSALAFSFIGCKAKADAGTASAAQPNPKDAPFMSALTTAPPPQIATADQAPPPEKTGGFDGNRGYAHVAKQVAFGPRPSGSPAIAQLQDYLLTELKSYGCAADVDSFTSDTPAGRIPMKNILVKIPGERPGIILLGTHYDTKRLPNFVGADDGGSSTGVMLELARLLCAQTQKSRYAVWIAFFDGEEAVRQEWQDPDNCYGSREMAARFALSGDNSKIKAFLLADLVGTKTPHFKRESYSTPALVDLVWSVAKRLGYGNIFIDDSAPIEDDHQSFLKRHVPSADVIDLDTNNDVPYWHTPQDTLDKISPKTLAITGHVFLESVHQLQSK
jgi:glutaminyl-peptide cyclotransferase